jgi:hypothetical protein
MQRRVVNWCIGQMRRGKLMLAAGTHFGGATGGIAHPPQKEDPSREDFFRSKLAKYCV